MNQPAKPDRGAILLMAKLISFAEEMAKRMVPKGQKGAAMF